MSSERRENTDEAEEMEMKQILERWMVSKCDGITYCYTDSVENRERRRKKKEGESEG